MSNMAKILDGYDSGSSCVGDSSSNDDSSMCDSSASAVSSLGGSSVFSTESKAVAISPGEVDGGPWKAVTMIMVLVIAAGACVSTYVYFHQQEEADFESAFALVADNIADVTQLRVSGLFSSVRSVAEQITKEGSTLGETFPFVTISLFEVIGSQMRETSGAESIYWGPIVQEDEQKAWIDYSVDNQDWLTQSRLYDLSETGKTWDEAGFDTSRIRDSLYDFDESGIPVPLENHDGPWEPRWQMSPSPLQSSVINYNMHQDSNILAVEHAADSLREGLMDAIRNDSNGKPGSVIVQPIYEDLFNKDHSAIVGHVFSFITFDAYLVNLMPEGVSGVAAIVRNTCGQSFTYMLDSGSVTFKSKGDLHDTAFDEFEVVAPFYHFEHNKELAFRTPGHCVYSIHIYPTKEFADSHGSSTPILMSVLLAGIFILLIGVFSSYGCHVYRRNRRIEMAADRYNKVVTSLFPGGMHDRILEDEDDEKEEKTHGKNRLKTYLGMEKNSNRSADHDDDFYKSKPMADLFTDTTVLFADIAGFTAWSSTREPTQVFILLETIYKAFDEIARNRGVFKVETVGDCYVAVTGLPDPRPDHAVAMARFAVDCMHRMHSLTRKLEVLLGPDTTELDMRFGIHSGPVTAGVLRGDRSRFQLFGDTMNTASRIESNGSPGRIQLSQETANLLLAAGKKHWVTPREEKIVAKGKGELQTYWLSLTTGSTNDTTGEVDDAILSSNDCSERGSGDSLAPIIDPKTMRLVQWNVESLLTLLKKVRAQRGTAHVDEEVPPWRNAEGTVITEVREIISLPNFDASRCPSVTVDSDDIELGAAVEEQLHDYVAAIASMYRGNPFHNFEHASHVTMSVVKLLSRIVAPHIESEHDDDDDDDDDNDDNVNDLEHNLHDHTYGITSDPLTQFACVFSALIHDVDHAGVPNTRLIDENPSLASYYNNTSIAEQNSVDLAWEMLQAPAFADLRAAIYQTRDEQRRFRELVVNSVMATDIMDKGLKALRNARWDRAFKGEMEEEESNKDAVDRKATIVIEHLIQASDVSHTMQHWHVYRKWNQRLFEEMYSAYVEGRAANDPSGSWYKGEMGFFDFYIIPLAKKLKDCGVFGVSSDEYLNYAEKNRQEWEERGQEVVAKMIETVHEKFGHRKEEEPVAEGN